VTSSDHPGLRLRLAHEGRRIVGQHAYLGALEATTLRALERGDAREIAEALHGFEGALGSHFDLEEQVHFPALHGHAPELAPELAALESDHRSLRDDVAGLRHRAEARDGTDLRAAFQSLMDALRDHEAREEALFPR
jgi:hypothetical protein